jgi:hypothetical protein
MKRSILSQILIPTSAILSVGALLSVGLFIGHFKGPQAGANFVVKYLPVAAKPATDRISKILTAIQDIPKNIHP